MKRFPDIAVISWQCDCGSYLSYSIDLVLISIVLYCTNVECKKAYNLDLKDINIDVEIEEVERINA